MQFILILLYEWDAVVKRSSQFRRKYIKDNDRELWTVATSNYTTVTVASFFSIY